MNRVVTQWGRYAFLGLLALVLLAGCASPPAVVAFFTVGACLKMALFPMHLWLPDAYTHAPSVVSAFLSGTGTKVAVYVLLRFVFTVFGPNFAFQKMPFGAVLMPAALAAILVTSTVAILQTDVKRMLAYSSLAQIGYIVLGISFDSVTGLTGGIVHLFNHALMKSALFMAVGGVALRQGSVAIEDLSGLARRMPWTMAAFTIGGLGLVGVPLTVGFVSKWYLMRSTLRVAAPSPFRKKCPAGSRNRSRACRLNSPRNG